MTDTKHCPGCEQSAREIERLRSELAALRQGEPVAWIRYASDGGYDGPLMHHEMEAVRIQSGAWTPLYTHSTPPGYQLVPCSFISDLVLLVGYASDAARSQSAFEFAVRMQKEIDALAAAKETGK